MALADSPAHRVLTDYCFEATESPTFTLGSARLDDHVSELAAGPLRASVERAVDDNPEPDTPAHAQGDEITGCEASPAHFSATASVLTSFSTQTGRRKGAEAVLLLNVAPLEEVREMHTPRLESMTPDRPIPTPRTFDRGTLAARSDPRVSCSIALFAASGSPTSETDASWTR